MSESSAWIINDESGHHLRRIIEAFPAARKSYVLELKEDLEKYVSAFCTEGGRNLSKLY